jgi:hypothetical protein
MKAPFLMVALLALALGGCWATSPGKNGEPSPLESGGAALTNVIAPALPGPLGGIVAGLGTLVTLAGGFFAGRAKTQAFAHGGSAAAAELNPLTKMLAERKWLFPIISALIAGGNAANLWHIDSEALVTLVGALNVPAAMEFIKDMKTQPAIVAAVAKPSEPPTS